MDSLFFHDIRITSCSELDYYLQLLGTNYIYRGQSNHLWNLETSLERTSEFERTYFEKKFDSEFRRRAHHFISAQETNNLQFPIQRLAMMQHYGIPTRLLDWTRSPYISAFFALSGIGERQEKDFTMSENDSPDAAIWAIYKPWLKKARKKLFKNISKNLLKIVPKDYQSPFDKLDDPALKGKESALRCFEDVFKYKDKIEKIDKGVVLLTPETLNARIMAQQGLFLVPMDLQSSFMENLAAMLEIDAPPSECKNMPVIKLRIPRGIQHELAERLTLMNVTGFSLFPDLEGLSVWIRSIPIIRPINNDNAELALTNFAAILSSNLKARVSIPNKVGQLNKVLTHFTVWGVNIEHCHITSATANVHTWSFDGTMSIIRKEFRKEFAASILRFSRDDFRDKLIKCMREKNSNKLSCLKSETKDGYLSVALNIHDLFTKNNKTNELEENALWHAVVIEANKIDKDLLYDFARLFIREMIKPEACYSDCASPCVDRSKFCENNNYNSILIEKSSDCFQSCGCEDLEGLPTEGDIFPCREEESVALK